MSLKAQLDAWARKVEARTGAIVKTAVQTMADEMNLDGPSVARPEGGKGGRLPVDTGFLKNSIAAAIGRLPKGPSDPRTDKEGDPSAVALVIEQWDLKQTLYIGWTAVYARKQELNYGFVEAALQKWPDFVGDAVAEAKRRMP